MVCLMADCPCQKSFPRYCDLIHISIQGFAHNTHRSCHLTNLTRKAQTALISGLFAGSLYDFRINERQRILISDINYNDSFYDSYLWRWQTSLECSNLYVTKR